MAKTQEEIAAAEGWFRVPVAYINERPIYNVWWHKDFGDPNNPNAGVSAFASPPDYHRKYLEAKKTVEELKKYFED